VATLSTCDRQTDLDTVVYLRRDDCPAGAEIACNDDACAGGASRVTPTVTAGTTYFIVVDGKGAAGGKFKLRVSAP
jgi:hypothetical protein